MSAETPQSELVNAVRDGDIEATIRLLAAGRHADSADEDGYTGLHWCCQLGQTDILNVLISAGALVDLPDHEGYTPIMVALNCGNEELAEVLLDHGADPTQSLQGFTLLHAAASTGLRQFADRLLSNPDATVLVNGRDSADRTPIRWATQENQIHMVEVLLRHGADPNAVDSDGLCALSQAAGEGLTEIAETLIQHGAKVNPTDDRCTQLPLIVAVAWEQEEMVKLLLANGAQENRVDTSGRSARSYAEETGNRRILQMLSSASGNL